MVLMNKALIKQMREITGASIQTCRMFLEVTNYDLDDAIGLLRERAIAINSPITRAETLKEAYMIYKSYRKGGSNE